MRTRAFVSIRVKLALATLIVLAEVTAGLYISVSHFAWRGMIDAKELAARMAGGLFLRAAATPVIFDDATGVADTVSRLAADPDVLSVAIWRAAAGRVSAAPLAAQRLPGA